MSAITLSVTEAPSVAAAREPRSSARGSASGTPGTRYLGPPRTECFPEKNKSTFHQNQNQYVQYRVGHVLDSYHYVRALHLLSIAFVPRTAGGGGTMVVLGRVLRPLRGALLVTLRGRWRFVASSHAATMPVRRVPAPLLRRGLRRRFSPCHPVTHFPAASSSIPSRTVVNFAPRRSSRLVHLGDCFVISTKYSEHN